MGIPFSDVSLIHTIVHWLWSTDSLEIMTLMDGSWGLQPKHLHLHLKWFYALVWERAEDWGWTQNHRFYDPYVAIHLSFEAYFIAGYLHITLFSKESRGLWLTSTRYSKTLAAAHGFVSLNSNFWISKALENQN